MANFESPDMKKGLKLNDNYGKKQHNGTELLDYSAGTISQEGNRYDSSQAKLMSSDKLSKVNGSDYFTKRDLN